MMRGVLTSKGATIVVAKVGMKVTALTALVSFIYFLSISLDLMVYFAPQNGSQK